jgi:hypothetical protein
VISKVSFFKPKQKTSLFEPMRERNAFEWFMTQNRINWGKFKAHAARHAVAIPTNRSNKCYEHSTFYGNWNKSVLDYTNKARILHAKLLYLLDFMVATIDSYNTRLPLESYRVKWGLEVNSGS